MDEHREQSSVDQCTEADIDQHLEWHCARAQEFFAAERLRMEEIEAELLEDLSQLSEQASDASEASATIEATREELKQRSAALEAAENQLRDAQELLEQRSDALHQQAGELDQREHELKDNARRMTHDEEALAQEKAATRRQRRRIATELKGRRDEQLQELADKRAALEQQQAEFDSQTHQVVADLTAQRDDLARRHAELAEDHSDLAAQRDKLAEQCDELTAKHDGLSAERDDLAAQLSDVEQQRDQLHAEAQQLQVRLDDTAAQTSVDADRALQQLSEQHDDLVRQRDALHEDCDSLKQQRDTLQQERDDFERQFEDLRQQHDALHVQLESVAAAADAECAAPPEVDDLRRRLELAMEDLRELRNCNSELEQQLAAAPGGGHAGETDDGFDWEQQKRRLFEAMDENASGSNPIDKSERLSLKDAIRTTDEIVAAKNCEIAELKRQLLAPANEDAGASEEDHQSVLDHDELIQQERQNLISLQEEMREKQRVAEVEISLERAKLARERSQIEDKLADYKRENQRLVEAAKNPKAAAPAQAPQKPVNRWMARLGLSDNEG